MEKNKDWFYDYLRIFSDSRSFKIIESNGLIIGVIGFLFPLLLLMLLLANYNLPLSDILLALLIDFPLAFIYFSAFSSIISIITDE